MRSRVGASFECRLDTGHFVLVGFEDLIQLEHSVSSNDARGGGALGRLEHLAQARAICWMRRNEITSCVS